MDVESFLNCVESDPGYAGQIVHRHTEPARQPAWAPVPAGLHPGAAGFLAHQGITRLYCHQAQAVEQALSGHDVLVTTSAASGKSLCFQLPILHALLTDPGATAMLLFPTKALARDQVAAWNRGVAALGGAAAAGALTAAAVDADAAPGARAAARNAARVLVTNPEMLHSSLLPGHGRWARFFTGLRVVVIDEVHTFNGFFGANMANVMRRLRRVCEHYGSAPRFICSSATLSNAAEATGLITGRPVHHVYQDGSPGGRRTYVFWNPPRIASRQWRGRRSANVEAHELMVRLVRSRVPTICFSKARNSAEMVYRYVRETLGREAPGLVERVIPYRGGYAAAQRRKMERQLREGEVLGVSTTRALELGIDIGMLDACLIIGYPGTLNAFLQQAGRAGRSGGDSLCVLVGIDTAINQYVMAHPEFIFARPIEQAIIDRDNPFVVMGHVRCATAELPVDEDEGEAFGYATHLALEVLEEKQKVRRIGARWHHSAPEAPASEVRLRGYGDESTVVVNVETGEVIDRLDKFRALRILYPGAIYFHLGDTYALVDHDTVRNVARVQPVDVPYYTDPVTGTSVDHVDRVLDERPLGTGRAFLGEVFAVLATPVFERVPFYSVERLSRHTIDQGNVSYEAMSFWLQTPPDLPPQVTALGLDPDSGMRGILYCVSRILPLFHTSDANDFDWTLGCRNTPWHTLFWFEFYMHGIGHAETCFERLEEILRLTLEHLLTCDCEDGCPNCTSRLITPYHVRNVELGEGLVMSRRAAAVVLHCVLDGVSPRQALALVEAPGRRRGMEHLPTVTLAQQHREPLRLPLDERTRALMLRKVERARAPRQGVDHAIDLRPPLGLPNAEAQPSLGAADSAMRSGQQAIRRTGDPRLRNLRQRLSGGALGPAPSVPAAGRDATPQEDARAAGDASEEQRLHAESQAAATAPQDGTPQVPPVGGGQRQPLGSVEQGALADNAATTPERPPGQTPILAGDDRARRALRRRRSAEPGAAAPPEGAA